MDQNLEKIFPILANRHFRIFDKKMSHHHAKAWKERLKKAFEENRVVNDLLPDGEIGFFFTFEQFRMHEFNEDFFFVSNCYCKEDPKFRRKFYRALKSKSLEFKKQHKIKRMVVNISHEDLSTRKYFSKKGFVTALELVGKTKFGLQILKKEVKTNKEFSVKRIQPKDVSMLVKLEMASHLADKSSRMHSIVKRPEGPKLMKDFYSRMLKSKNSFVVKKGKEIAGSACYFIDNNNKYGLIGSIFVAKEFQGMGISKILYKELLQEFYSKRLTYYLGSSTTGKVLSLSAKLERRESSRYIIVKI